MNRQVIQFDLSALSPIDKMKFLDLMRDVRVTVEPVVDTGDIAGTTQFEVVEVEEVILEAEFVELCCFNNRNII